MLTSSSVEIYFEPLLSSWLIKETIKDVFQSPKRGLCLPKKKLEKSPSATTVRQPSTSACKLSKAIEVDSNAVNQEENLGSGIIIVNMNILVALLQRCACTECGGETMVELKNLGGLAQRIIITCGACPNVITQDLGNILGK